MHLRCAFLLVAGVCLASAQVVARLSSSPPLSAEEIAQLEAKVQSNPADMETRLRLLSHYRDFAPAFQATRIAHILYLVDTRPEDPIAASPLTYISGDPSAQELVRRAWLRATDAHPASVEVHLNAARFLYAEHADEAEEMLTRFLQRDPSNRKIAANLGFFYAMDMLGLTGPSGSRRDLMSPDRERLAARARAELDRTTNPLVLAAAATALPNLFMRTQAAHTPNADRAPFEFSSTLMARARQLNPHEPELRGPMPLIREFQELQNSGAPAMAPPPPPAMPGDLDGSPTIRVGGNVQASKLVEKPDPMYPPLAEQARIQGIVRFNVLVGRDGSVENATLISGHPLLVPAATEVVRRYRYQPTLLNGAPVKVISQVEVPFTLTR